MATPPKPGDSAYGHAPEGSLSEERARKAAVWVEKEVFKLLQEIESLGRSSGNEVQITFGELFTHYQDVSDTLVGIMARAKKRDLIKYEGSGGQMLFQGKHDHVIVTLDKAKSHAWSKEYLNGTATIVIPAGAIPKKLTVKEQFEEEKRRKSGGATPSPSHTAATPTAHQHKTPSPSVQHVAPAVAVTHTPPVARVSTPPPKPVMTESPKQVEVKTPVPVAVKVPDPVETTSFLATMMGKLLPSSPQGSVPTNSASPEPAPTPAVQADSSSLTRTIMASVSKFLPSASPSPSPPPPVAASNDIGEDVLKSVRLSASKAKLFAQQQQEHSKPAVAPGSPLLAALPQRTRDGTRGAVVKTPPSSPGRRSSPSASPSSSRPVSQKVPEPVVAPAAAPQVLKKEQEEWAKKHVARGVVSSSSGTTSAYAKLTAFQDDKTKTVHGHNAHQNGAEVTKKTGAYEKQKQSSTLPTGLQKRFAWE